MRDDGPPAGYVQFAAGTARVVCAEHLADSVRAALADTTLYEYAARQPAARALAGRGTAYAVSLPGTTERVVIRHNRHGGFFAPLLARDVPVAGISAYGTIAFTPTSYPGRSERFFREIAGVDILAAWAAVDTRVQMLHGTYDAVSTASDHAKIAAIVNGVHPGRAEHREFEGLDHCETRQQTPEAGRDHCGGGEVTTSVDDAVLEFIGRPR